MDLSFREKSIAGSLVITMALFGYYFIEVFKVVTDGSSERLKGLPATLLGVVIAIVIVEVIYHTAIALGTRGIDESDERDIQIEARSTRIAYFVLAAGCITTVVHATLLGVFGEQAEGAVLSSPIMTANLVLASFILAEIIGFGMRLFYYRRGI